jgi:hypothetical protein
MNYAVKATHLTGPRSDGRSLQLLTAHDADSLEAFYLGLDFDNRRSRFGGGQSDQSIVAYCRTIHWQRAVIIARGSSHLLDAVLEIHPLSQNWDRAEITLACPLDGDRSRISAELFQLAAVTAGGRGCSEFVMYLNDGCADATGIFGDMARKSCDGEVLSFDIRDYAITARWRGQRRAISKPEDHSAISRSQASRNDPESAFHEAP